MKKHLTFIAALGSLLLIPPFSAATFPEFSPQNNPVISQQTPAQSVQQIAKSITVKILLSDTNGSGVIITKKGQTYTVLTNAHVVTRSKSYRIQTPDGNTHLAVLKKQGSSLNGDDLAILEFQSDRNYALASFGNSTNLIPNETVFSAGFPVNQNNLNFLSSNLTLIASQPLKGGYQIGYTNQTEQGMSGGALLNQKGQLIGIIGMGTGAVLNEAYQYQNGSFPPQNLLSQMRKISFAVPLNTLNSFAPQFAGLFPDNTKVANTLPPPSQYTGIVKKINDIAEQITVKINIKDTCENGSGIIIAKQGNTYYVLTARHVMKTQPTQEDLKKCKQKKPPDTYTIITPDKQEYKVNYNLVNLFEYQDLAIVQFTSNKTYQVATLAKYDLEEQEQKWIFTTGFPADINHRKLTAGLVFSKERAKIERTDSTSIPTTTKTDEQGLVSAGLASASISITDNNGYELLYSNITAGGMSGGAILDSEGRLIGIHTGEEQDQVGRSFGISISTFLSFLDSTQKNWLTIKEDKPPCKDKENNCLSTTETDEIKANLFDFKPPTGEDAENSEKKWFNYGDQLWRASEYEKAVKAFDQAIKIRENYWEAYYKKGIALKDWGIALKDGKKYEEALIALDKASQYQRNVYGIWREKFIILYNLDRKKAALEAINRAIEINKKNKEPLDFVLYVYQGDIFYYLGKNQEAIASYDQAIEIKPDYYQARSNKGIALENVGKYPQAIESYDRAIKIKPDSYKALNNKGIALGNLGKYQEAIAFFDQAIKIKSDYYLAWNNKGSALVNLGKYQEAIASYDQAIKFKPDYYLAWYNKGVALMNLDKIQEAIRYFDQAIKFKPNYAEAWYGKGAALGILGKNQEAITYFDQAIKFKPNYAEAWYGKGLALGILGKHQESISSCDRAIEIKPGYYEAWNNKGIALMKLGKYEEAIASFDKAIKFNPDYAESWYNKGVVLGNFGKYQEAIASFDQAIKIKPDYYQAWYNKGVALVNLGQYQEAIAFFDQAINIKHDLAAAWMSRGAVYVLLGNKPQAISNLQTAAQLFKEQNLPQDAEMAMQLIQKIQNSN